MLIIIGQSKSMSEFPMPQINISGKDQGYYDSNGVHFFSIESYITYSLEKRRPVKEFLILGEASEHLKNSILYLLDIKADKLHINLIPTYAIHIYKEHISKVSSKRPLWMNGEIERLPQLLDDPYHSIRLSPTPQHPKGILLTYQGDIQVEMVVEASRKNKRLSIITAYKTKETR
jgi:hypothetical protein